MFKVELSDSALEDLRVLRKTEQVLILDSLETFLAHEPMTETRRRKPLRPNAIASWELRIDQFRVFYDVDAESEVVLVKAVGWKDHNTLFIHGKEHEL
jgi:mRNA-degrading endonuclease RelE of RelBE toxin-antitoxin system